MLVAQPVSSMRLHNPPSTPSCKIQQQHSGQISRGVGRVPCSSPRNLQNLHSRSRSVRCRDSNPKILDVVALSNLCVDVFVPVETLPPSDTDERRQLLDKLSELPPDRSAWEIGGTGNFMIAAARMGMSVSSIGHIGNDMYGEFLQEVLHVEGIEQNQHLAPVDQPLMNHTLQQVEGIEQNQHLAPVDQPLMDHTLVEGIEQNQHLAPMDHPLMDHKLVEGIEQNQHLAPVDHPLMDHTLVEGIEQNQHLAPVDHPLMDHTLVEGIEQNQHLAPMDHPLMDHTLVCFVLVEGIEQNQHLAPMDHPLMDHTLVCFVLVEGIEQNQHLAPVDHPLMDHTLVEGIEQNQHLAPMDHTLVCFVLVEGIEQNQHLAPMDHPLMDHTLVCFVLVEGIEQNQHLAPMDHPLMDHTLVCFVLVDPQQGHAFCSRYDFGPWPLLEGVNELPPACMKMLCNTRAVFTNGFVFDELPVSLLLALCNKAISAGASLFFDPGPRCFTMKEGARREALEALLDLSTVVLMTEDEAQVVTGLEDPEAAAISVLARPNSRAEWCVVKLGSEGALLRCKAEDKTYRSTGFKVEVEDTVGCGDSFASAIVLGYNNKYSIPHTLALANAVGASTAMKRGAGRNVADSERVSYLTIRRMTIEHMTIVRLLHRLWACSTRPSHRRGRYMPILKACPAVQVALMNILRVADSERVVSVLSTSQSSKAHHEEHREHAAGALNILRMSLDDA
eukprot:gene2335-8630_t